MLIIHSKKVFMKNFTHASPHFGGIGNFLKFRELQITQFPEKYKI